MKIEDVQADVLRLPSVQANGDGFQDMLLVRITTSDGLVGIGEAHTLPSALKAIIDAPVSQLSAQGLRQLLVGEDPRRITYLWEKMYSHTTVYGRRGIAINAISAIDIALWDLAGKRLGVPISQLLGGAHRSEVKTYASDLMDREGDELTNHASALVERGYRAMKFGWGRLGRDRSSDLSSVRAVREAVGDDVDIMIDLGVPLPFDTALRLCRDIEEYQVRFVEEPLSPDDLSGYAELVARSPVPIATGEKETTRFGFVDLMERGCVRIIQPDLARCGGITELVRIATLAEVRGAAVIPHSWASDILMAATLQVLATRPSAPYVEFNVTENSLRNDLLLNPVRPTNGYMKVPDGPGLGITLNESALDSLRWNGRT